MGPRWSAYIYGIGLFILEYFGLNKSVWQMNLWAIILIKHLKVTKFQSISKCDYTTEQFVWVHSLSDKIIIELSLIVTWSNMA